MEYNALVGIYNVTIYKNVDFKTNLYLDCSSSTKQKYKLLCPRGTQTCALAVANIAHAVYLLDVAKRPIPQG